MRSDFNRRAAPSRSRASSRAAAERGDPELGRDQEHPPDRLLDPRAPAHRALLVVARELAIDVDQAAGVGDEVGRVEDPALGEPSASARRRAGCWPRRRRSRSAARSTFARVDRAAERARREHVALGQQRLARARASAAPSSLGERAACGVDVGDGQLAARLRQPPREPRADVAEADHARPAPGEVRVAEARADAGADRGLDARSP